MSLMLTCTHNSATYHTRNFLHIVKNFVSCQNKTVWGQLLDGVRCIDLRVVGLQSKDKKTVELWCAHTFLTVPLLVVIRDIAAFIKENPSEVLVLTIVGDYSTIDADKLGWKHYKGGATRIKKIEDFSPLMKMFRE